MSSVLRSVPVCLFALAFSLVTTFAYGQGTTTTTLSGLVVDTSGAVIPGADVKVKSNATSTEYSAVTGERGDFSIPAVHAGSYTVTVSLMGFKTVVLNNVTVNAAVPATVRVTLEVGALQETVLVQAESASIVQTQTPTIATTIDVNQVAKLPVISRNALDFITTLAGVSTPGGNRDSTINGLPKNAINITIDGINVQDNTLKSTDGFFTIVQPRLDAVEEVTVTTAAQGAEGAGQGAVQIQFITRSGSNQLRGSAYHYYRSDKLNANTWFNERNGLAKPALTQHQPGARVGGPVVIPGLFDGHDKLFFFFNYEDIRQPQDITRNRTVLTPQAQAGVFRYSTPSGVQQVNLLALAAANGHVSSTDPTTTKLLADIRAATGTTGSLIDLTDPNVQRYSYNLPQRAHNRFPTVRIDYNLTDRHRLMGSWNYQRFLSTPDTLNGREPLFPGFPVTGNQTSTRVGYSSQLRSTLGSTLVNEFRAGGSGAPVQFFPEFNASMWSGSLANQAGFFLNLGNGSCCTGGAITNASGGGTPSSRNAYTFTAENTLSWIKGAHSFSFGGAMTNVDIWLRNQTLVPEVRFGIVPGDPVDAIFTQANFPGASTANLNAARGLYSILVGRVREVIGNAGVTESGDKYTYLGPRMQRGRLREMDFFAQDRWKMRPDLTVSYGLRYAVQQPFTPLNNSYATATLADAWGVSGLAAGCDASAVTPSSCNIFKPGTLAGKTPEFVQFKKGERAYNSDWDNFAPSVGFNWTPSAEGGFLRTLLGDQGDTAIRGGYSRSYNREGMANFTNRFGGNPGVLIDVNRTAGLGNLGPLPVLLRDSSRLSPPPFAESPQYPLRDVVTGDINLFDPDLQVPYATSFSVGIQRSIGRNTAVEARYVGTRGRQLWRTYNYNEVNILENGFLDEFKLAQQNLQANIAAGRGNTFRYAGPGTGTSPLPIFLAYFTGVPASQAGDASRYTSALFTNATFVNPLARLNPNPFAAGNALDNDLTRRNNALRAGLPANFLVANPDLLGGVNVTGNGHYTNYDAVQLEVRRRLSHGLQFNASYVYGKTYESVFFSFRQPLRDRLDSGSPGHIDHALKGIWVYELPFGRGRRFGGNAGGVFDRFIGGWQIHGIARIQSGRLVDFGNVRLVGMTKDELFKAFDLRIDANRRVWQMPQDIIDNTVKAFDVSATSPTGYGSRGAPTGRYLAPANGPDCIEIGMADITNQTTGFGECGTRTLVLRGPVYKNVDVSLTKSIRLWGDADVRFAVEMLNALDTVNYLPVAGAGSNPDGFEITGLNGEVLSRAVRLVSRISW